MNSAYADRTYPPAAVIIDGVNERINFLQADARGRRGGEHCIHGQESERDAYLLHCYEDYTGQHLLG